MGTQQSGISRIGTPRPVPKKGPRRDNHRLIGLSPAAYNSESCAKPVAAIITGDPHKPIRLAS